MIAVLKDKKGFMKSITIPYPMPCITIPFSPSLASFNIEEPMKVGLMKFIKKRAIEEGVILYEEI